MYKEWNVTTLPPLRSRPGWRLAVPPGLTTVQVSAPPELLTMHHIRGDVAGLDWALGVVSVAERPWAVHSQSLIHSIGSVIETVAADVPGADAGLFIRGSMFSEEIGLEYLEVASGRAGPFVVTATLRVHATAAPAERSPLLAAMLGTLEVVRSPDRAV